MKKRIFLVLLISLICLNCNVFAYNANDKQIVQESLKQLNSLIPGGHPRLLLLKKELPEFRSFVGKFQTENQYPEIIKKLKIKPSNQKLPQEPSIPKINKKSSDGNELWRQNYKTAFNAGMTAQRHALAYLVTGEKASGREAARWLNHIAQWNPNKGTSLANNDEAFIQLLRPMIFAYDWSYDALTSEERVNIEKALQKRLEILFQHVSSKFSLTEPTPLDNSLSHPMRFISTLGLGGLALYERIPEAPVYLAWAYEYYSRQFPVWGGADGGWSEGLNYWRSATQQHFLFYDAMSIIGTDEFLQRDFYRNNAYFAMYNWLPYQFSSFGDLCNILETTDTMPLLMNKFALLYEDPYIQSFADTLGKNIPSGMGYYNYSYFDSLLYFYRRGQKNLQPLPLADLPRSRVFENIGWVALHSHLGDSQNDIMFGLKSSPYGSVSHSFSDQNSFVLNAFGEPLAISSGYREWYGSPHHLGWSRTTASKNAVLFGGKGQEIRDPKATGKITDFHTGKSFDFAAGDATVAYRTLTSDVKKAVRKVLFLNGRYFLIYDELLSGNASKHQWLIHSKSEPNFDNSAGKINIRQNQAGLSVQFIIPTAKEIKISKTNEFAVPVDKFYQAKMPKEWHVTAETLTEQKKCEFLTFLIPYRETASDLEQVKSLDAQIGKVLLITNQKHQDKVLLASDDDLQVRSTHGKLDGSAGIISSLAGELRSFVLINGKSLSDELCSIDSQQPITLEGIFEKKQLSISVEPTTITTLRIKIPFVPRRITGISEKEWSFDSETQEIKLNITKKTVIIVE